jgi:hypothetical protein
MQKRYLNCLLPNCSVLACPIKRKNMLFSVTKRLSKPKRLYSHSEMYRTRLLNITTNINHSFCSLGAHVWQRTIVKSFEVARLFSETESHRCGSRAGLRCSWRSKTTEFLSKPLKFEEQANRCSFFHLIFPTAAQWHCVVFSLF